MILEPDQYPAATVYELLAAAARGRAGLDRKWLSAILSRGEEAIPDLLRFGLEERGGDRVDIEEDLIAIFRRLRTPRAIPYFIHLLRRNPLDATDELLEAVAQFPAEALEPLLTLHDELDESEREEIVFLLAALKIRDQRILDRLLARINHDPADAAFCLGVYGDPAARPHLEALLEAETGPDASSVRESARQALAELGEAVSAPDIPPEEIWDRYPEDAPPRFELLDLEEQLEFFECRTKEWRCAAAAEFLNRDLPPAAREALFRLAQHDSEPDVRARAWEALGSAIDDHPSIREAMKARLDDAGAPVEERCGTLVGLAREADDPLVRRWMLEFYGDPRTRAKALEAMRGSFDRRFAAYFPQHLDDPDPEIRRQAIWGVGELGIRSQTGRLRSLFDDEEFREDALYAYALALPVPVTPGRVRAILKRIGREASGLTPAEARLVELALDSRLILQGYEPAFPTAPPGGGNRSALEAEADRPRPPKPGRNAPCPCGSGKKYKKCCGS